MNGTKRTIYLDPEFKCHVNNDGSFELLTTVETDAFNNFCDEYIEGYRFVPKDYTWTRSDGVEFRGEMIAPHTDYN